MTKYKKYNYENSRLVIYAISIKEARMIWKLLRNKVELDYDSKLVKYVGIEEREETNPLRMLQAQVDYINNLNNVSIRTLNNWFNVEYDYGY